MRRTSRDPATFYSAMGCLTLTIGLMTAMLLPTPVLATTRWQDADPAANTNPAPSSTPIDVSITYSATKGTIVVGANATPEQRLLSKMIALMLVEAGYDVVDRTDPDELGDARTAIKNGEIDLYVELIDDALARYHNIPEDSRPLNPERAFTLVRSLDARNGIWWLEHSSLNRGNILLVNAELADQGVESIADLATIQNTATPLTFCVTPEFLNRLDGLSALAQTYGFELNREKILPISADETYAALREQLCNVAQGVGTDGRVSAWGLQPLADPLHFFLPNNPAPVIRQSVLDAHPELPELLRNLGNLLTTARMSQLNARMVWGADGERDSGDEETLAAVTQDAFTRYGLMNRPPIVVGAKPFTEQRLLGKMLVLLLEGAGYDVVDKTEQEDIGSVRAAMERDEIDLYIELTGTALSVYYGLPPSSWPVEPSRAYRLVKNLDEVRGIIWLEPGDFRHSYTMMVQQDMVAEGITGIEDLAQLLRDKNGGLTLCVQPEFYGRLGGLYDLQEHYGFRFAEENILIMEQDELYEALRTGQCDVAEGVNTDARVGVWGFHNLDDSRGFFPLYTPAPVIRHEVLERYPELEALLATFGTFLDNATLSGLNARVDLGTDGIFQNGDEESVADVARDFLTTAGVSIGGLSSSGLTLDRPSAQPAQSGQAAPATELVPSGDVTQSAAIAYELSSERLRSVQSRLQSIELQPIQVTIGSSDDVVHWLLGQMYVLLLEDAGYSVVDKTGLGNAETTRREMLRGEIDLSVEFLGSVLRDYHKLPAAALPNTSDRAFELAQRLDESNDLIWLVPGKLNNRVTFVVKQGLRELNIADIGDLADYMNANDAPLSLCIDTDVYYGPDSELTSVQNAYGFQFDPQKVELVEPAEVYNALRNDRCAVAIGTSLDARVSAWGFHLLEDTSAVFPADPVAPVLQQALLQRSPGLEPFLEGFGLLFDGPLVRQLSARAELGLDGLASTGDEELVQTVARDFLCAASLIDNCNSIATVVLANNTSGQVAVTETELPDVEPTTPLVRRSSIAVTIPQNHAVNARAGISTDTDILAVLPRGSTVVVIGRLGDNSWLQVVLPDQRTAWVFRDAVIYSQEEVESLPIVVPL